MGTPLMMDNLILIGIAFLALLVIGLIFSRLYRRSSKERAFVRTGLGGQKVVMDGGALVFPVFHETILVNMNTLKLEVMRFGKDSLFTKDRMRVDVVVAFFVRVVTTTRVPSFIVATTRMTCSRTPMPASQPHSNGARTSVQTLRPSAKKVSCRTCGASTTCACRTMGPVT